nr:MBL fold metallo-hydrolase [Conexibacter arvalis]
MLAGEGRTVLLDAGVAATPARTVAPALRRLGRQLDLVVVSHADVDHSGGLGALQRLRPGLPAAAHARDREQIASVELMLARRYREFRDEHAIDQEPAFVAWVRDNADDGAVTETVADGDRLDLGGGWALDVLHLPGHTPGHLALHDPADGTAIVADAVLGAAARDGDGRAAFAPTYRDVADYRATIARLRALAPSRLLTSHFPVVEGGDRVAAFLDESERACDAIERAVLDALAGGAPRTAAELIAAVAERVRSWPPAADGTLAQPVVGHLEELAARGLVARAGGRPVAWRLAADPDARP